MSRDRLMGRYRWAGLSLAAIATAVAMLTPPAHATFSGHNGKIAYNVAQAGAAIYLTDFGQLTSPPSSFFDEYPSISPDGSKVAFVRRAGNSSSSVLMTINTDGTDLRVVQGSPFFGNVAIIEHAAWAGGERMAFAVRNVEAIIRKRGMPLMRNAGRRGVPAPVLT